MLKFGIAYFVLAGGVVFGLHWYATAQYGGGNHWVFFGSGLDRAMQVLRFWAVPLVVLPLLVASGALLLSGRLWPFLVSVVLSLGLAYLVWRLVLLALD